MFHTNDECDAGTIYFEVWRPDTVNKYILVGVNTFTPADCPVQTNEGKRMFYKFTTENILFAQTRLQIWV